MMILMLGLMLDPMLVPYFHHRLLDLQLDRFLDEMLETEQNKKHLDC